MYCGEQVSSQSLGLVGTQVYLTMKSVGTKNFVAHFDLATDAGVALRISLSSMYKVPLCSTICLAKIVADMNPRLNFPFWQDFKSTPTWLQLPFRASARRWTVLHLDLDATLRAYTSRRFTYIKGITLCANMLVRNVIVTNEVYAGPEGFPKEMRLLVPKDATWHDTYELIRFPKKKVNPPAPPDPMTRATSKRAVPVVTGEDDFEGPAATPPVPQPEPHLGDARVVLANIPKAVVDGPVGVEHGAVPHDAQHAYSVVRHSARDAERAYLPNGRGHGVTPASTLPSVGLDLTALNPMTDHAARVRGQIRLAQVGSAAESTSIGPRRQSLGLSTPAAPPEKVVVSTKKPAQTTQSTQLSSKRQPRHESQAVRDSGHLSTLSKAERRVHRSGTHHTVDHPEQEEQELKPSVFIDDHNALSLASTIGFSSTRPGGVCWSANQNTIVYACHRVVVMLDIATRDQKLLLGHSARVEAMAVDAAGGLLVSSEHGRRPAIRVWDLQRFTCVCTLKTKDVDIHVLSLSADGHTLVTVGRCRQGLKQTVALWDVGLAYHGGKLVQIDRTQTDASITRFVFAPTDPHCMVSCGHDNIRVWRFRRNQLRSTPVNLAAHHSDCLDFTDMSFLTYHTPSRQVLKTLVSASSGAVFEIDVSTIKIIRVHRLSHAPLRCIHAAPAYTITGGDDQVLRVWPNGFSESSLEAKHAGAVCCVQASPDEAKTLVGTGAGSVGVLDLQSQQYTTVMRAHLEPLAAMAARPGSLDVVSLSRDGIIIIWSLRTHEELFDFQFPEGRWPAVDTSRPPC